MDIKFAYAGRGIWRGFNGSDLVATVFLNNLIGTFTAQLKTGGVDLLKSGFKSLAEAQDWIIAKGSTLNGKTDERRKKSSR